MKRMIVIHTNFPHTLTNMTVGRVDTFWCSEKCERCIIRFKCYTEPERDAFELDFEDYKNSRLELGVEIG